MKLVLDPYFLHGNCSMASPAISNGCYNCLIWCCSCCLFTQVSYPVALVDVAKVQFYTILLWLSAVFIYSLPFFFLLSLARYLKNSLIWKPKYSYCRSRRRVDYRKEWQVGQWGGGKDLSSIFFPMKNQCVLCLPSFICHQAHSNTAVVIF